MKWIQFVFITLILFMNLPLSLYTEPEGQPKQIQSSVKYDSTLSDPFFKTKKWSYPWWAVIDDTGAFEDVRGEVTNIKDVPRLKHSAKCQTNHFYDHTIRFCAATLKKDRSLELYLHDETASTNDNLKIIVKDGIFTCQYWTAYFVDMRNIRLTWITKKQELTLDKNNYKRGDIVKGKIEFECIEKRNNQIYCANQAHTPYIIKIKGVFKSKIE